MKLVKIGSTNFDKLINRNSYSNRRIAESVKKILDNVRLNGDDAVIKYTRIVRKSAKSARWNVLFGMAGNITATNSSERSTVGESGLLLIPCPSETSQVR